MPPLSGPLRRIDKLSTSCGTLLTHPHALPAYRLLQAEKQAEISSRARTAVMLSSVNPDTFVLRIDAVTWKLAWGHLRYIGPLPLGLCYSDMHLTAVIHDYAGLSK